ncbi:Homeodomain-like domain-containing protein [Alkalispirillum mobile]|uniref:Homeodomain-like domain-containing protein n=1 Tax=Alkalispirillum mobile TaxID=85925 RepID=A0A498C670_9GAMM|nr:helix-turn-helix domain-containing protein [Alkalispirillum mobile]RLK50527.1 Homeodomain-like domain-containing protein [Alkalispirillum mobile]
MARKSPLQLYQMALALHRDGWPAEQIADHLGLHPGSVTLWLDWPRSTSRAALAADVRASALRHSDDAPSSGAGARY